MAKRNRQTGTDAGPTTVTEAADTAVSTLTSSDERVRALLHDRAVRLSQVSADLDEPTDTVEVVLVTIESERYAIESSFVREVCPMRGITPVPCTPPFVAGLINLRGEIISVIDLREFFDLPKSDLTSRSRVVVLRNESMEFGILVDEVTGVQLVPWDLQPGLPTMSGARSRYLQGITRDRLTVLDAAAILADEQLIVRQDA